MLRRAGLCTACKAPSPCAARCARCRTPGNAAVARRHTPRDIARWIELRRSGLSVSVIAPRVGASPRAIYKRTTNRGARSAAGRPSRFAPDALSRWADLYRGGLSVRAIATREGVSVGAVTHGLNKLGVAMRRPGRPVSNASAPKELSR
jgi:hypothetical protein